MGRTGCEEAHFPVGLRWTLCTHLAKSCCSGTALRQTQALFVPAQPSTMMCKQGSSVPNPATGAPGHASAPTSRGLLAPGTTHSLCYSSCQLKCSESRLESLLSAAQRRPHVCTLLLYSPKSKEFTGNHSLASGSFIAVPPVFRALRKHQPHTACTGSQPQHHSHGVLSCLQTSANSQIHGINKDTVPHVTPRTDFATFVQSLGTNRATPPAQSVTCHEHSSFWAH